MTIQNVSSDLKKGFSIPSYGDFLLAYKKEVGRILNIAEKDKTIIFKEGFNKLLKSGVIAKNEVKTLEGCVTETMKARTKKSDVKRTITYLQNNLSKGLIEGNASDFYLNYINLCLTLTREAEIIPKPRTNNNIIAKSVSTTFPAGSGGAILAGALGGAVIGSGWGPGGAILGGLIGGLIGTSTDVTATVDDGQGGGSPT